MKTIYGTWEKVVDYMVCARNSGFQVRQQRDMGIISAYSGDITTLRALRHGDMWKIMFKDS